MFLADAAKYLGIRQERLRIWCRAGFCGDKVSGTKYWLVDIDEALNVLHTAPEFRTRIKSRPTEDRLLLEEEPTPPEVDRPAVYPKPPGAGPSPFLKSSIPDPDAADDPPRGPTLYTLD